MCFTYSVRNPITRQGDFFAKTNTAYDAKQDHTPTDRIVPHTRPLPAMLSPGVLTAHYPYHLMLLGSPPDMVHEG